MKIKYTPGPWTTSHENLGHFKLEAGNVAIIDGCGCCDSPWLSSEADARLIAAAPDLLEALTEMEEHFRGYQDDDGFSKAMFKQVRAALAKATGEQA